MSFFGVRLRRWALSLVIVCLALGATTGVAGAAPANISHGAHVSHFVCNYICFGPYVVYEDTFGDVVTTLMGRELVPLGEYKITLSLSAACENNLDGLVLTADLNGRLSSPMYAGPGFFQGSAPCTPTRFYVFAQLQQTPYTTFANYLKILAPAP